MQLNLDGKVALVTGGGQGVGRRICLELANEGAKVVVNDLVPSRAESVLEEITSAGGSGLAIAADITQWDEVERMVGNAERELGGVDILVNNAGVIPERREKGGVPPLFLEMSQDEWRKVIDLNVYGAMNCCRAVLPGMVKRKWGKIISIMSEAGRIGEARLAVYSGAKAAMLGFSKALAKEHGADCINVNLVALGATAHEGITSGALRLDATPDSEPRLGKMFRLYPMAKGLERLGRPEDVSGIVAFLASDRAAFITGQSLGVSGGYAMQ